MLYVITIDENDTDFYENNEKLTKGSSSMRSKATYKCTMGIIQESATDVS